MIELVGAGAYASRPIGALSGGEQQRLLIAQALVRRARDRCSSTSRSTASTSPTRARSPPSSSGSAASEGVTVLLVAHDVNPILGYLDRVVYFAGGRGVAGAPSEVITGPTLSRLYGVADRGAARPPTAASSSSARPSRRPTTTTATSMG